MDAHRAHYLLGHSRNTAHRHQLLGTFIDLVAIVADKDALLDAEHRTPQLVGFLSFPRQRGPFDAKFGRRVQHRCEIEFFGCARNRFAKHDHTSYEESDEQAPHLPQPALMSLERRPASESIAPSGCRTDFMNSGVGAG